MALWGKISCTLEESARHEKCQCIRTTNMVTQYAVWSIPRIYTRHFVNMVRHLWANFPKIWIFVEKWGVTPLALLGKMGTFLRHVFLKNFLRLYTKHLHTWSRCTSYHLLTLSMRIDAHIWWKCHFWLQKYHFWKVLKCGF